MEGLITKILSDKCYVKINKEVVICGFRGIFRTQKLLPLVGDKVLFDKEKRLSVYPYFPYDGNRGSHKITTKIGLINYNDLENKPKLNNTTLEGEVDYDIMTIEDIDNLFK